MLKKENRNISIDGLRGMAAFLVVCYHMFFRYQEIYYQKQINFLGINLWGEIGVAIFFVLSGVFSMQRRKDTFSSIQFLRHKICRLWPTYLIAISITFILTHAFVLQNRMCSIVDYILNVCFLNGFIGSAYVDSAHWYITSLLGIYFVVSIINKYLYKYRIKVFSGWLIIVTIISNIQPHCPLVLSKLLYIVLQLLGGRYISLFIIGVLIRIWIEKQDEFKIQHLVLALIAIGMQINLHGFLGLVEMVIAFGLVLIAMFEKFSFFRFPPLVFLGKASYSIYLIHQNIGFVIQKLVVGVINQYSYLAPVIATVVVIGLGVILYITVEKNSEKMIKLYS